MNFYVFHSTPMKRVRVHAGPCKHCREGKGQENQDKNGSGATGWDGPFKSLEEAENFMGRHFRFKDVGRCGYCLES
jgi:hypothetical protein